MTEGGKQDLGKSYGRFAFKVYGGDGLVYEANDSCSPTGCCYVSLESLCEIFRTGMFGSFSSPKSGEVTITRRALAEDLAEEATVQRSETREDLAARRNAGRPVRARAGCNSQLTGPSTGIGQPRLKIG